MQETGLLSHPWSLRRTWQPHSTFLSGKSVDRRAWVAQSLGSPRVGCDLATETAAMVRVRCCLLHQTLAPGTDQQTEGHVLIPERVAFSMCSPWRHYSHHLMACLHPLLVCKFCERKDPDSKHGSNRTAGNPAGLGSGSLGQSWF